MWGRLVIKPSDAEEFRQEFAFSGDESTSDGDEMTTTPQYQTFAEDMDEEHTPRTHFAERPATPPRPGHECKTEGGTSPRSHMAPDQTEAGEMGITERVGAERLESSPHTRVLNSPEADPEVGGAERSKARQHAGFPTHTVVDPEEIGAERPEAPQHPEVPDRSRTNTEASTSGLRPTESEAAPNTGATPPEEPSSSRFRAAFEVLGRGLLGHPMEANKNLIPEGF
jgi:hypothetical protein